MKRILILTSDKNQAVQLRAMLESMRQEFEIAIGEETGRAILSQRYMNLIMIDAATLKSGSSWVFDFLTNRGLRVPIVVLGAEKNAVKEVPSEDLPQVAFVAPPIDLKKLSFAISAF
jgi:DNA-binding NtrC family response regulator